jgi:hypothetical protein
LLLKTAASQVNSIDSPSPVIDDDSSQSVVLETAHVGGNSGAIADEHQIADDQLVRLYRSHSTVSDSKRRCRYQRSEAPHHLKYSEPFYDNQTAKTE